MAFCKRAGAFLLIFLAGFYVGWEYAIAGMIFFLALGPRKYEYLLLGALFDILFLFPKGFFTLLAVLLIFSAEGLERALQSGEFSSFIARNSLLAALAGLWLAGFAAETLWPNAGRAVYLAAISSAKTFGALAILVILYQPTYAMGKIRTKKLRFFGA
ncbi:MAG: hypothetical protein AAB846_00420 [Patescibacteria group bacterium]|mgnify:CR=1 FL=1